MRPPSLAAAFVAACALVSVAEAQTQPTVRRLTVAGGLVWSGDYAVGEQAALLRQNATGSPPPSFTLFRTATSFESTIGVEGRVGFSLTPSIAVEGGVAWSRPHLAVAISDDVEGANASFDGETTSQYVIEGSLVWMLPIVRGAARLRPFVFGGAGYLRQLYEERTLAETGQLFHVGGGVQYLLRGADGRRRPLGVRGDARAYIRRKGIELEDQSRTYPALSALVFVGF
ncbi:MAG: hypothetical protein LC791_16780 [Acidobacteria bacterium]|nr:hypothetical protein [Acidobacteriota bacterium]